MKQKNYFNLLKFLPAIMLLFAGMQTVNAQCPDLTCNPNSFLNTNDPNCIEYDNMVGLFHSTILREADGKVKVWGEDIAPSGSAHLLVPTIVNNANGFTGIGISGNEILKSAAGSSYTQNVQFVILTTQGLYVWGKQGRVLNSSLTSGTAFAKIGIGTYNVSGGAKKADGLPAGVSPADVKMMFGSSNNLIITTKSGAVWALAQDGNRYGNGATDNNTNDALWHRVTTGASGNPTLDGVVAARGNSNVSMALTADGKVYTWGSKTRLGNGTSVANNTPRATLMTLPKEGGVDITPKMIGATNDGGDTTYYILSTTGNLYSMGEGSDKQLGNFTNSDSDSWVRVQKSAAVGDYLTNVVYISPQEHDTNYGAINVLTADGRLWGWGANSGKMLGASGTSIYPTEMPGSIAQASPYNMAKLNWTDEVIAVETGGHTSMIIKDNNRRYGYVGHKVSGSMGDGTSGSANVDEYNFGDTPEIDLCAAPVNNTPVSPPSQTVCLNNAATPFVVAPTGTAPFTYQWYSNAANSNSGGTAIGGETSDTYTPPSNTLGTMYYYVVVTDAFGTATSDPVSITVQTCAAEPNITSVTPTSQDACLNSSASISVTATGDAPLSYQWYDNGSTNSNVGGTAVGTNSPTYAPPTTATGTKYYYVVVTNAAGSATSNAISVTVNNCCQAGNDAPVIN